MDPADGHQIPEPSSTVMGSASAPGVTASAALTAAAQSAASMSPHVITGLMAAVGAGDGGALVWKRCWVG